MFIAKYISENSIKQFIQRKYIDINPGNSTHVITKIISWAQELCIEKSYSCAQDLCISTILVLLKQLQRQTTSFMVDIVFHILRLSIHFFR